MIFLCVSNKLTIKGATTPIKNVIKKGLALPNADYYKALKRNPGAVYYLSPFIKYYDEYFQDLVAPRGVLDRVRAYLESKSQDFCVEDSTSDVLVSRPIASTIKLRDYQLGIAEELASHRQGIARLDTGFGKTIIALKLYELLGRKTLVIVPRLDLLQQFQNEFIRYFPNLPCGTIQGQEFRVEDFTVATVQSLRRKIRERKINSHDFGMVIVDEAHLFVPSKFRAVVEYFCAKYRFGLTATARRTDEQGEAIQFIFGPILVDRSLKRERPRVQLKSWSQQIHASFDYHKTINDQVTSEPRNTAIAQEVLQLIGEGRKVLVLCKRIDHYQRLAKELEAQNLSTNRYVMMAAKLSRETRAEIYAKIKAPDSKISVVLGTFPLLSTGIDIPQLDTLLIAGDLRSTVLAEQSAGRILRLFCGKKDPLIVDFVDTGNGVLRNQAKGRQKFYREQGWEIVN